jgi:malate-CoA ligase subunit alpha
MGHAGAIVNTSGESAAEKVEILQDAGVMVSPTPSEMGATIAKLLKRN